MSSLRRSIRRAVARRNGTKWPERNNGQIVEGTLEGRPQGARVFDYENWFAKHGGVNTHADVLTVHFRHPTKQRTDGRTCKARFIQSAQLQKEHGRNV